MIGPPVYALEELVDFLVSATFPHCTLLLDLTAFSLSLSLVHLCPFIFFCLESGA
jgi:hypothetical protein